MKNLFRMIGIIAITAIIGFGMIACDDGSEPSGGPSSGPIVIKGTIGGVGPSPNIISRSAYDSFDNVKKFSGTVQGDNTIQGILEDGDMLFKLTGVYDPETKAFSMQAASSMMVFALTGRLTASNAIDASESSAVLHVKQDDNWDTISLGSIAPSNATVSGSANQVDENITPEWARGVWFDQLTGLKITVSEKAVSMSDGDFIVPFNVLDIELKSETTGSRSLEILTRAVLNFDMETINYTSRFYVAESWDTTLSNALGSVKLKDIFDFLGDDLGNKTLTEAAGMLGSKKMFIAPFCATAGTGVITDDFDDMLFDGYSPLFTADNNGSTAAKNATALKPVPTFFMALEPKMNNYFVPAVGELTITGLSEFNGKFITAESNSSSVRIRACDENFNGVKVQNNQVKLNVYTLVETGNDSYTIVGYEGSGILDFEIFVSSFADSLSGPPGDIDIGSAKNVAFTTGKATAAYTSGPRITINGLSDFNGKYVSASAKVDDTIINAAVGRNSFSGVQILGGQAVLKVSAGKQTNDNSPMFSGNGEVKFDVIISSSADDPYSNEIETGSATITLVDFSGTGTYKGPPTITITGLNSHNGKYIVARSFEDQSHDLIAIGGNKYDQAGAQISGGQAALKVFEYSSYESGFTGNGSVTFNVYILPLATDGILNLYEAAIEEGSVTVTLTNFEGSAVYTPPAKLTVTGLSEYNGKYIDGFTSGAYNAEIDGYHYIQATGGTQSANKPALIINGTAILNVYSSGGVVENGPLTFSFVIYNSPNGGYENQFIQGDGSAVTITSGVGTCTFTAR